MSKLAYGQLDGKGLSYSRRLTLHKCPRKFQLENIFGLDNRVEKIDFSYGHAVGAGIQALVVDPSNLNFALISAFANWKVSIFEEDLRGKKSIWYAVRVIEKFYHIINNPETNFLRNYEIAKFADSTGELKPAVELTFKVNCPYGYSYEGHIDLVLKEKNANKYIVLELKTTKFTEVNDASYQNSDQGLGYSLVLDSIAKKLDSEGSFAVLYLIAKSTKQEFEPRIYNKSRAQRAQFINELLLDIEILEMFREVGVYPMRGESCFDYFTPCEFFGRCTMSDSILQSAKKSGESSFAQLTSYDFEFDLETIKANQEELL